MGDGEANRHGVSTPHAPAIPQDREAEALVLGSVLRNRDHLLKVQEILRADDFYSQAHLHIFQTMLEMSDKLRDIDHFTLSDALKRKGILEEVGGMSYIAELEDLVPASANVEEYARIVREKAMLRKVVEVTQGILQNANGRVEDAEKFADEAERRLFEVTQRYFRTSSKPIKTLVKDYIKKLEYVSEDPTRVMGVRTGFHDLDKITHGFQKGDLIIVAGRPGMGKTSFCLNVAAHASIRERVPVIIFTLEMSAELLVMRMFSSEARVDSMELRRAVFPPDTWEKLVRVASPVSECPMEIEDSGAMTVREIRSRSRRLKTENRLGLIIIDYLQLLGGGQDGGRYRSTDREREIAEISRSLKGLAKELEVPCIAVSQLNRQVESRDDKRPHLADLRESGAIEQDADLILFLYRDAFYNRKADQEDRTAEAIIGKNRNGPTKTIELTFFPEFNRFENKSDMQSPF
ncbi:MAG: replicative DNA helicase [Nitrospirae bacterium]|nr:replicative DNA helicase [Nitrospirota bacterium]